MCPYNCEGARIAARLATDDVEIYFIIENLMIWYTKECHTIANSRANYRWQIFSRIKKYSLKLILECLVKPLTNTCYSALTARIISSVFRVFDRKTGFLIYSPMIMPTRRHERVKIVVGLYSNTRPYVIICFKLILRRYTRSYIRNFVQVGSSLDFLWAQIL